MLQIAKDCYQSYAVTVYLLLTLTYLTWCYLKPNNFLNKYKQYYSFNFVS